MPRVIQLALGGVTVLAALFLSRVAWSLTTKMVVFAVTCAAVVLVALWYERRLPRGGAERTGPDEVMPGAESALPRSSWQGCGALAATGGHCGAGS